MSTTYYIQFIPYGTNGSALSLDGGSFYQVSDYSFGAAQTLNIGSQSSGAGAGKATFDDLSFTLGSSALTAQLDQRMASGTPFQFVDVYGVDSAGLVVTQDEFKLAAVGSDTVDAVSGAHAVTMEYGGVVENRPQNPDGTPPTPALAGWNKVTNTADKSLTASIDGTAPATPPTYDATKIATGAAGPDQNHQVFVEFRDSSGLVGGNNGGWIEVSAASFEGEQTLNIGAQSSGAGAGKVTFDPLDLTFAPGTLEPLLLQDLASGISLQVELAAYTNGQLVDDYRFGTAALKTTTRTVDDAGATVEYSLEYGQEQLTRLGQDAMGAPALVTTGWDRVNNVALTATNALPEKATATQAGLANAFAHVSTGETDTTTYYIQFIPYGTNGSALSLDGGSFYQVSDYSFGAAQTLNIGSQSSGAGAGKATFDDLSFTLGSSALTAQLDQRMASGTPFQFVDVYGVDSAGLVVTQDEFKLAAVGSDTVDAVSGAHAVTMEYGGVVENRPQNPDGTPPTPALAGWNKVTNTADKSLTASIDGTAPATPPTYDATKIATGAAGPDQNHQVFVEFRDSSGLVGGNNGGWIEVSAASFEGEQTLNIGAQSSGAGAGKVTFDPLDLTFAPGTLEPLLLQDLASGISLQVELAAYTNGQLVDDYRFGTAALKTTTRTVDDAGATVEYSLEYGQEQLTRLGQDAMGAPALVTTGWDRVNNVALTATNALPEKATATQAGLANAFAHVSTGETDTTTYYIQFIPYGTNGSALSLDGGSFYQVSDYSFGAAQTLNIGSQSSGAGAGKATFDDLSFTLGSSALTAQLDQRMASGTPFQFVDVYGVDSAGLVVTQDEFKLAAVGSDTVDAVSGAHAVTMEYGGVVENRPQNPDGTPPTPALAGWNKVTNTADKSLTASIDGTAPATPPTYDATKIATGAAGPDQNHQVFVEFRDSSGLVGGNNGGWIEVSAASFEGEQTLNIGAQSSGAGAGKVTFDPLDLTFAPGTLEPLLLQDLASGISLQVELAAYTNGQLVDDYRFGTAALKTTTRTVDDAGATVEYSLEYGQEQLTRLGQDAMGAPALVTTGWDRVNNVALTATNALPEKATATQAGLANAFAHVSTGETGYTVSYFEANQAQLDQQSAGFYIADTAPNIADGLSALQADQSHIAGLSTSDNKAVTIGISKFSADRQILDKVSDGFAINGQASAVESGIDALEADVSKITSIATVDGIVTVGIGKFTPDQGALDKIVDGFAIAGQASVVASAIDALEADVAHITSIGAVNGRIAVGIGKFTPDRAALNKVSAGFDIAGQAPVIQTNIDALGADSSHIGTITALNGTISVGIGKFKPDQAALDKIVGGFAIAGQSSAIRTNIDALGADASHITSIAAVDGAITVGVGKFMPDRAALDKITAGFNITGMSAAISSNFDALAADASHITALSFIDANPVLSLTVAQAGADASLLAKTNGAYVLNVANGNGTTTTTGHGTGLTVNAVSGGQDTITGNGASETFVFTPTFGHDTLTDFASYLTGTTHDTIQLPAAEFMDFGAVLQNTSYAGTGANATATITAGNGDQLVLQHMTQMTMQGASGDFKFA